MPSSDVVAPASEADGEAIFALLTKAFGDSYLKFSVYQALGAKHFLIEQIRDGAAKGEPRFFVLKVRHRLVGFYNAEKLGEEFFLKYIASDSSRVRSGVGSVLLDHFEATAAALGCLRSGLGVFESNAVASSWYGRRGYRVESCDLFLRFELGDLDGGGESCLEWDAEAFERALTAERKRGFSAVTADLRGVSIRLGLIGGNVVNVLDAGDATPARVAAEVAARLRGRRRWLLMRTAVESAMPPVEPETLERSLHMVREIP